MHKMNGSKGSMGSGDLLSPESSRNTWNVATSFIVSSRIKDLEAGVKEGWFLEDLYFRLNVVTIHLPPLRDRSEDIPLPE